MNHVPDDTPAPYPGSSEPMASSPLWLAYSGLPEWLNREINRNAWLVFKTVVEMDCARNARPATIEAPPAEIARRCGLAPETVMRTLVGLRRKKCLALFVPEHPEENGLFEVKIPLPTPRTAAQVREEFPFNRLDAGARLRYAFVHEGAEETGKRPSGTQPTGSVRRDLQRVIDLYLNTVGFKMNSFVLDELRLLCQRFDPDEVEKAFARAAKNDIRSLGWVAKELYRRSRRHERGKT